MGTNQHLGSTSASALPNVRPSVRRSLRGAAFAALRNLRESFAPANRTRVFSEGLESRLLLSKAPVGPVFDATNNLTFYGTKKADLIVVSRDTTGVVVTLNGTAYPVGAPASIKILAGRGKDTVRVEEDRANPVGPVTIDGGSSNDKISGGFGNDTLIGGSGNDLLIGSDGNDSLAGGSGNDRLLGGEGDDTLIGGKGKNVYSGGNGNNTDDSLTSHRNILSPTANAPTINAQAKPLTTFGTATGLTPGQIRTQYGFGNLADSSYTNRGQGQAIAVVIPYDVLNVRASVNTFATRFSLPQIDVNTLQIINAGGTTPPADPDPNHGWEAEACLNLEWAHAIAPAAQLYLILADSDLFTDLFVAVDRAVDVLASRNGGGVTLMTFGSQNGELNTGLEQYLDQSFTRPAARNISFVTGAGDVAGTPSYPSTSPYVVSVGGTSLQRDTLGNLTGNETAWSNGGGGQSTFYPTPGFQQGTTVNGVQVARRATPDISFDADPNSGLALYVQTGFGDVTGDSVLDNGWLPGGAGGTSAAAPNIAGLITLANQLRAADNRAPLGIGFNDAIYDLNRTYPGFYLNDITSGTSGGNAALVGYDLATGNGSPRANFLIDRLQTASTTSLAFNNLTFTAEFREAINKIGSITTPGAGFVNGTGSISGNNNLALTLTPRYDLTPITPAFISAGTSAGNNITPAAIQVANFTPINLLRLDNNSVTGTARVNITILLIPAPIPTPTTSGPATTGTGIVPTPVPGFFVAGLNDSVPPNSNGEIRTWVVDLNFAGKIARDKHGREHISGSFINRFSLYNPGGAPVEGLEPIFRGTFKA